MGKSEPTISPFFIKRIPMKKILLPLLALLLTFCSCKQNFNDKTNFDSIDEHMEFRKMGDLDVGIISIRGTNFAKMDTTESRQFMDSVLRKGVNYIDLCDADTTALNNVAFALKGRRNQMMIQGPLGNCWKDSKHTRPRNAADCQADLEKLLARLGTGYLNVGMLENINSKAEWQKLMKSSHMKYLDQLKEEGKIKRLGLVCSNVDAAYAALQSGLIDVLQFQVDPSKDLLPSDFDTEDSTAVAQLLATADTTRTRLYEYCKEYNIAIVIVEKESGKPSKFSRMEQMHFAMTRPGVVSILSNASTMEDFARDLHYLSASDEEKDFTLELIQPEPDEEEISSDN